MLGQDAGMAREDVPQRGDEGRLAVIIILITTRGAEYPCCALTRG
jgi:hypothetical protein